jgi:hypothetical protein
LVPIALSVGAGALRDRQALCPARLASHVGGRFRFTRPETCARCTLGEQAARLWLQP